jgi:hypothetical protein
MQRLARIFNYFALEKYIGLTTEFIVFNSN